MGTKRKTKRSRLGLLAAVLLLAIPVSAMARRGYWRGHAVTDAELARHIHLWRHADWHPRGRIGRQRLIGAEHARRPDPRPSEAAAQKWPVCDGLRGRDIPIDTSKPVHLGLETYPETLDLQDHEVVLTFDDGPSARTTPEVLDALRRTCVEATFFLIGRNAAALPRIVQREAAEGHTLGHHSMTHPAATLRALDDAAGERNIDDGIAGDEKAAASDAGTKAGISPFFRFPGFADTKHLLDYLDGKHMAVFGTDLWAADWLPMTPDHERERVIWLLERSPHHSGIILFHDTRASTAEMLPAFLRELKAKGYTIAHLVPAKPGDAPMKRLTAPEGWTSETEAIIAHNLPGLEPGAHRVIGRRGGRTRYADAPHHARRHARTAARSWSRRS